MCFVVVEQRNHGVQFGPEAIHKAGLIEHLEHHIGKWLVKMLSIPVMQYSSEKEVTFVIQYVRHMISVMF